MPSLAAQVPGMRSVEGLLGVEDPRAFVHGGRPHLLVTFHQMQPQRKTWARERQVRPPGHYCCPCPTPLALLLAL